MKRIYLSLLMICTVAVALAQDVMLTVTSSKYPFRRGQWTQEQCEAWQKKYGAIRGINCPYPPCDAMTQEQAIGVAASMGYNSVRWWPTRNTSTSDYIQAVEQWAAWADKYGMTVAPVFNFGNTYFDMADHQSALKQMETQVRAIIKHFRGDDRIILWDIWNEPSLNDDKTGERMQWIAKMVQWCQEEGCTQPITASIVWDSGVNCNNSTATGNRLVRENTERLMDLHNYHDYTCQDGFNAETESMVNRFKRMDNRPLVCTECMQRVSGSGYARTLIDFAKYNVNFYTWGLYSCRSNWDVRWDYSLYYNWDVMFHNALYSDGEPVDETEPQWVSNFEFQGDFAGARTGAEFTEVWSPRRAWRRQQGEPRNGLYANSISEASTLVSKHKNDGEYNQITVRLPYTSGTTDINNTNRILFNNLLNNAENAGMKVMPVLLINSYMGGSADNLATYVYNVINRYYTDRRIDGWCVFQQTGGANSTLEGKLKTVMRRARYSFPNQPMFLVPQADGNTQPDSTQTDFANILWQMSDVAAYTADAANSDEWEATLVGQYKRPVYAFCGSSVQQHRADRLNNADGKRWPAWKAWRWMNRGPVKGLYATNITAALTKMNSLRGTATPYNSISLLLDYRDYISNATTFYANVDSLLKMAGEMGMTVLPQMMTDTYINMPIAIISNYISDVLQHYADDERILGWDIYYRPGATSNNLTKVTQLVDQLFTVARQTGAQQPIYATPPVSTSTLESGYDVIDRLTHGHGGEGWDRIKFGNAGVELCYRIWCMSDIIAYASSQDSRHLGYLNAHAGKFGRPIFCDEWKTVSSEPVSNVIDIFQDWHVSWFTPSKLTDEQVEAFHHIPVEQKHN